MAKKVSLPFFGILEHSQGFGARPEIYSKFGLKGHDGDDWLTPIGTPVYSPLTGEVSRVGYDQKGWGMYFTITDRIQKIAVTVSHLSNVFVLIGESVKAGARIAESGNTGFSELPHIHAHANDADENTVLLTPDDGYKGRFSILDTSRVEIVPSPAEVVDRQATTPPAVIDPAVGPQGIIKGSYAPEEITQEARQWLWQQFGHTGEAPVGYGGEEIKADIPTGKMMTLIQQILEIVRKISIAVLPK